MTEPNIVAVEDDPDVGVLLQHWLAAENFHHVTIVATPKAAMHDYLWTAPGKTIGVIDLMLPGVTGNVVARWVRERHPDVYLICLTALKHGELIKDANEIFDCVIEKTYAPGRLMEEIRRGAT